MKKAVLLLDEERDLLRIVDSETKEVLLHGKTGTPLDGGGHSDQAKAERQVGYINAAFERAEKKRQEAAEKAEEE